jgi:hypothetical protein
VLNWCLLETPQVVILNHPLPVTPKWLPTYIPVTMIKVFWGILQSVQEILKILQYKQIKSQELPLYLLLSLYTNHTNHPHIQEAETGYGIEKSSILF